MPSRDPIRTYVPEQHKEQKGPYRGGGKKVLERNKLPVLIRLFVWLLVFRSAANLIFALIVGLAPDSAAANYVSVNFDAWPKQMPPEGVFYVSAFLYGLTAWRWHCRDWRARWFVMFLSGAMAAKMLGNYVVDHAAGAPMPMTQGQQASFFMVIFINVMVCAYLAFYPGMAQAFRETPWE
ncbi:MAG TPA: hypothetical protein VGF82_00325 [Terracidiphilus sp.]|jgi:hypothetical protein